MPRPTLLSVAITLAVCLPGAVEAAADTLTGKVVHIADGDTITVLDSSNAQHKIRLWGIDAPETGHGRRRPGQPFGTAAKDALGGRIHDQQVTVETHGTDKYGRTLGTHYGSAGEFIESISARGPLFGDAGGFDWVFRGHSRDNYRGT